MKRLLGALIATSLFAAGGASLAVADGESTTVKYSVKGKVNAKKFRPVRLEFGVGVSTTDPRKIQPLRQANLRFPGRSTMIFSPKKRLPKCSKSQTALKAPPERIYQLCPKSVIGNGVAAFQLGKSVNPANARVGTVVVLYGGKVGKNHKILFSAWSSDTNAGVFAQGVLKPTGQMNIAMPVLTADSAVTTLNINIPGKVESGTWGSGVSWSLRKGLDPGFVKAKCKRGKRLPFSARFTLGERIYPTGESDGPASFSSAKSSTRCGR